MHREAERILEAVLNAIERSAPITLDRAAQFGGQLGDYWVQFEGEDDLLHCLVRRLDGAPLALEEAHRVVEPFFGRLPKGIVWCKPAGTSVHYYVGHDHFLQAHRQAISPVHP
jgi:hypothetical protein